jgi:predicted transcriptional regulator
MIAQDLLNYMIPALKPTDTVDKALNWMEDFKVGVLPLVEGGVFLGYIEQDTLLSDFGNHADVSSLPLSRNEFHIFEQSHYSEVVKLLCQEESSLIAVVDEAKNYKGVITSNEIVKEIGKSAAVKNDGAIIVLSMLQSNYSLAEISRLIESNDAKVLSVRIEQDSQIDSDIMVTIKINIEDATKVTATLERFNYKIAATFSKVFQQSFNKDRFDILMKYLQM